MGDMSDDSLARRAGRWYGQLSRFSRVAVTTGLVLFIFSVFGLLGRSSNWTRAVIFLAIGAGVYFLPTIVAGLREAPNKNSVFVVNLFLGWTLVGWVVALAIAFGQTTPRTAAKPPTSNQTLTKAVATATDIRQCPFCAEDIKKAAIVCKHCGRDVPVTE